MEFKNGYRLLYQKAKDIYASKKNIPTIEDEVVDTGLTEEEKKNIKLVYEKKEGIIVNFTGLPTVDDKPIELTAGGEVVVGPSGDDPKPAKYKPFELGQVLKVGDKIHFDITKEADFLAMCKNVDWEKWQGSFGLYPLVLDYTGNTLILGVMKVDMGGPEPIYAGLCGTVEGGLSGIFYISADMPDEDGKMVKAGFINLDADGNITLNEQEGQPGYVPDEGLPATIDMLTDEAEPHWNGSIISYVVSDPEPVEYTPFSVGDDINIIGSFKVNTSANIDNIFSKLPYSPDGVCELVLFENHEALADALLLAVNLSVMGATGYLIAVPDLGGASGSTKVIYATSAGELPQMGLSWIKGWQNYTDDTVTYNLGIKDSATAEITSLDTVFSTELNGKVFGKIDEPGPTPSLTSFELGQTVKGFDFGSVSNGDTNADLDAFLLALEPGSEALMVSSDDYEQLLLCGRFEGRDGQPSAGIIMDNATGTFLYATDDYYEQGEKLCSKGYQNLADGKYILPGDITFEIAHMNEDLEDTSWNGRLVGAVLGEPSPTPSLTPFEVGKALNNGNNIHFDTTVDWDTFLAEPTYDGEGKCELFRTSLASLYCVDFSVTTEGQYNGYAMAIGDYVIYSTIAIPDYNITRGFQESYASGDFTWSYGQGTISAVNDTIPTSWNGVIIGITES